MDIALTMMILISYIKERYFKYDKIYLYVGSIYFETWI